jgi:hypothetical protein
MPRNMFGSNSWRRDRSMTRTTRYGYGYEKSHFTSSAAILANLNCHPFNARRPNDIDHRSGSP